MRYAKQRGFLPIPTLIVIGVLVFLGGAGVIAIQNSGEEEDIQKLVSEQEDSTTATSTRNEGDIDIELDALLVNFPEMKSEIKNEGHTPPLNKVPIQSAKNTEIENKSVDEKSSPITKTTPIPEDTSPRIPSFAFNQDWRDAVVNLVCEDEYGNILATGSGVVIDPRGIILTNAHVASDWLFTEKWSPFTDPYTCKIRTGNPATYRYTAEMLYISRERVVSEALSVFDQNDEGYEKRAPKDYALLVVTGTLNPEATLPDPFSYMPMYLGPIPQIGSYLYTVGYPARFISPQILRGSNFRMMVSPLTVKETRSLEGTLAKNIVAFQGVVAAQHGASGGAVVNNKGELVAIPTFFDKLSSDNETYYNYNPIGETSGDNVLNAITVKYMDNDLAKDIGLTLKEFISQNDPVGLANTFMERHTPEYQCIYSNASRKYHGIAPLSLCLEWE